MLKRIVYVLTIGLAIFLVSYALAATINISNVRFLGGGETTVSAPNVTGISWVLERHGNRWMVTGVKLTFDGGLPSGSTVYVDLLDSSDNVIANGNLMLSSDLPSGQAVTVNISPYVRAQEIVKVAILVAGPSL